MRFIERVAEMFFYVSMVIMFFMIGALTGKLSFSGNIQYTDEPEYKESINKIKNEVINIPDMKYYITVTFPELDK